jgi:hypothetical protein
VFSGVVVSAEQLEVGEFGFSSMEPVDDVVNVAPARRSEATRMLAVAVAGDDGSAQGGGYHPGLPPDVERFGVRSENDPGNSSVAGDSLDGAARKDRAINCFTVSMSLGR